MRAAFLYAPSTTSDPGPDDPKYGTTEMLYIDPDTCIDCAECVDACPVDAIFYEFDLTASMSLCPDLNRAYFALHPHDTEIKYRWHGDGRRRNTARCASRSLAPALRAATQPTNCSSVTSRSRCSTGGLPRGVWCTAESRLLPRRREDPHAQPFRADLDRHHGPRTRSPAQQHDSGDGRARP